MKSSANGIFFRLMMLLLAGVLSVVGWKIASSGFESIQKIRQIERLPTSTVSAALVGEAKFNAIASAANPLLESHHFGSESIYWRYRYEIEETDSDGNKYWSTQYIREGRSNFYLTDESGKLLVNVQAVTGEPLEWSLPVSQQVVNGSQRHTEWLIRPDDRLFVLGYLQESALGRQLGFIHPGQYIPMISRYSEAEEKSDIGMGLILRVCGGISILAFAALSLAIGLGIHRVIVYLIIMTAFVAIPLVHLGLSMIEDDLKLAYDRIQTQTKSALNRSNDLIGDYLAAQTSFSQLNQSIDAVKTAIPPARFQTLQEIQLNLAYEQEIYLQQTDVFPNNIVASLDDLTVTSIKPELAADTRQKLEARLSQSQPASALGVLPKVITIGGLIACLLISWLGYRLIRLKRHIENLPTSKSTGLVFGLSEIKGRMSAHKEEPHLTSPLTHQACYWYFYHVQEERGSGDDKSWVTIEKTEKFKRFDCVDPHGRVMVYPEHAEIISKRKKVVTRGRRRYTERILKLNDDVYILGHAKVDKVTHDRLVIRASKEDKPYLITNLSEEKVMMRKAFSGMSSLTLAFSTLIFATLFYLGSEGSFAPADYLMAALIAPVYMSLMVLVLHYNDLVFLRRRAKRNLANIDVSLQKRFDLIPNLEKIVKQHLSHEKKLQEALSKLRSNLQSQNKDVDSIDKHLNKEYKVVDYLLARFEKYPELKSDQLSVKLMNTLVDLENEVALMREGYNDAVTYYNTRIATIPDVFFARFFGFKDMQLFRDESVRFKRVTVDFDEKSSA